MTRTPIDHQHHIARLRRTLLLLAANQSARQQVEAAARHLELLYRAMLAQEAASGVRLDHPQEGEEGTSTIGPEGERGGDD